jgi:hypothetical protein
MTLRSQQRLVLCGFAVLGWVLCGATMGIGLSVAPLQTALVIHAVAAPLIFGTLAVAYFRSFPHASPVWTAVAWVGIVMLLDFFVVALLIERDLAMFGSPLGTWIPFALIFLATLAVGWIKSARGVSREHSMA